jgi:hypothetical protein
MACIFAERHSDAEAITPGVYIGKSYVYLSQVLRDLDVLHGKSLRHTLYVYAFWMYFFKLPAYIAISKRHSASVACFADDSVRGL